MLPAPDRWPETDSAGHHHSHYHEGLPVEEPEEKEPFIGISADSGGMFFHQLSKDRLLEHRKHQYRKQGIPQGEIGGIGRQTDPEDIGSRYAPHQRGEEQQGVSFYFHALPSCVNIVQFPG